FDFAPDAQSQYARSARLDASMAMAAPEESSTAEKKRALDAHPLQFAIDRRQLRHIVPPPLRSAIPRTLVRPRRASTRTSRRLLTRSWPRSSVYHATARASKFPRAARLPARTQSSCVAYRCPGNEIVSRVRRCDRTARTARAAPSIYYREPR